MSLLIDTISRSSSETLKLRPQSTDGLTEPHHEHWIEQGMEILVVLSDWHCLSESWQQLMIKIDLDPTTICFDNSASFEDYITRATSSLQQFADHFKIDMFKRVDFTDESMEFQRLGLVFSFDPNQLDVHTRNDVIETLVPHVFNNVFTVPFNE